MFNHIHKVLIALCSLTPTLADAASCKMSIKYHHYGTKIYSAEEGISSLYYQADMDVNTDGAARSYHPDDPRGRTLAYNNMGNAITRAWNSDGERITCDNGNAANRRGRCFDEYIEAFEGARNINYKPNSYPRIETKGIIPWVKYSDSDWKTPCLISDGINRGFFVSQTSLRIKQGSVCDQSTYVDSLSLNAVVYPRNTKWYSKGVYTDQGDLVVTRNRSSGKIAFAIHGDKGPEKSIGEGSIALTSTLSGKEVPEDASYSEVKMLAVIDVDYIIFPTHDVEKYYRENGGITQDRINEFGEKVFEEWGGVERLNACSDAY